MSFCKDPAGQAALSIVESLLLALDDHRLLSEREIRSVLEDAATTHENAIGIDGDPETHRAAAVIINRIIAGGNFVRRPR